MLRALLRCIVSVLGFPLFFASALWAPVALSENPSAAQLIAAMPQSVESVYVSDVSMMAKTEWKSVADFSRMQAAQGGRDLASEVHALAWGTSPQLHALGASDFVMPKGAGGSTFRAREIFVLGDDADALRSTLENATNANVLERVDRDGLRFYRGRNSEHVQRDKDGNHTPGTCYVCLAESRLVVLADSIEDCSVIARELRKHPGKPELQAALKARWGDAARQIDGGNAGSPSPLIVIRAIDPEATTDWLQRNGDSKVHKLGTWPPRDVLVLTATTTSPVKLELRLYGGDYDLPSSWLRICLGLNRSQAVTDKGVLEIIADPFTGHPPRSPEEAASILWMRTFMVFGVAISI